jgi:hypothetical protein
MSNEFFTMMSDGNCIILRWTFGVSAMLLATSAHGLDGIGHDVEIPNIAGQHSVFREQLLAFKAGKESIPRCSTLGDT